MTPEKTSQEPPMPMEIDRVAEACARQFGVTVAVMRGKRRNITVMKARYMAAHICHREVHRYRLWKVRQMQGEHSGYWIAARVIHTRIGEELGGLIDKDPTSIRWYYDRACEMLDQDEVFRKRREAIISELEKMTEMKNGTESDAE